MNESETAKLLLHYIERINKLVESLQRKYLWKKNCGENIYERKIVEKILICVIEKYYFIVTVIEESKYLSKLSMTKINGFLRCL